MRTEVQEGHLLDGVADALRTDEAVGERVADGSRACSGFSDKHRNREYLFATPVAKIGASACLSDKNGGRYYGRGGYQALSLLSWHYKTDLSAWVTNNQWVTPLVALKKGEKGGFGVKLGLGGRVISNN